MPIPVSQIRVTEWPWFVFILVEPMPWTQNRNGVNCKHVKSACERSEESHVVRQVLYRHFCQCTICFILKSALTWKDSHPIFKVWFFSTLQTAKRQQKSACKKCGLHSDLFVNFSSDVSAKMLWDPHSFVTVGELLVQKWVKRIPLL